MALSVNKKRRVDLDYVERIQFIAKPYYCLRYLSELTISEMRSIYFPRSELFYSDVKSRAEFNSEKHAFLYDLNFKRKMEYETFKEIEDNLTNGNYYSHLDAFLCSIKSLYKNPNNSNLNFDFFNDILSCKKYSDRFLRFQNFRNSFLEKILNILSSGLGVETEFKLSDLYNTDFDFGVFSLPNDVRVVHNEESFLSMIYYSLFTKDNYVYKLHDSFSVNPFKFDFNRWSNFVDDENLFSNHQRTLLSNTFNLGKIDLSIYNTLNSDNDYLIMEKLADKKNNYIIDFAKMYSFGDVKTNCSCLVLLRSSLLSVNYKNIDYTSQNFDLYLICLRKFFLFAFAFILNKNITRRSKQIYKFNLNSPKNVERLLEELDLKQAVVTIMSGEPIHFISKNISDDQFVIEFANQDREDLIAISVAIFLEIHIIELFWKRSK